MIKFIWMNLEDSGTKEGTTYLDNILDATEHVLIGMILSNPDNGQSAYKLTWHLVLYFIGGIRAGSPFKPIMKPKRSYSVNTKQIFNFNMGSTEWNKGKFKGLGYTLRILNKLRSLHNLIGIAIAYWWLKRCFQNR